MYTNNCSGNFYDFLTVDRFKFIISLVSLSGLSCFAFFLHTESNNVLFRPRAVLLEKTRQIQQKSGINNRYTTRQCTTRLYTQQRTNK